MSECIVIGVTGGIGAGKSTVLKYLKDKYEAIILEADSIAKMLMLPGGETYQKILDKYGDEVKKEDGFIDNAKLSETIFKAGGDLNSINEIAHPAVIRYMQNRIDKEKLEAVVSPSDGLRIVIIEAAILFEGGAAPLCDDIWYVYAPESERIERLMKGRGYTLEKCQNIISKQMSDEEFRSKCSFVLPNSDGDDSTMARMDERICELERRFI